MMNSWKLSCNISSRINRSHSIWTFKVLSGRLCSRKKIFEFYYWLKIHYMNGANGNRFMLKEASLASIFRPHFFRASTPRKSVKALKRKWLHLLVYPHRWRDDIPYYTRKCRQAKSLRESHGMPYCSPPSHLSSPPAAPVEPSLASLLSPLHAVVFSSLFIFLEKTIIGGNLEDPLFEEHSWYVPLDSRQCFFVPFRRNRRTVNSFRLFPPRSNAKDEE